MSLAGGYTGHLGDYSTGAAQAIMPYVVGGNEVYQQQTQLAAGARAQRSGGAVERQPAEHAGKLPGMPPTSKGSRGLIGCARAVSG